MNSQSTICSPFLIHLQLCGLHSLTAREKSVEFTTPLTLHVVNSSIPSMEELISAAPDSRLHLSFPLATSNSLTSLSFQHVV